MKGGKIPNAKMAGMLLEVVCEKDYNQNPSGHPDTGTKFTARSREYKISNDFRIPYS
jgi:hypothetical protein